MIGFSNHYKTTVWIAFQWLDQSCQGEPWRTEGWFQFAPGETSFLNIPELADLQKVGTTHYYYYVESADGTSWGGPFLTYCPYEAFKWCNNQSSSTARLLGFREIIIENTSDYTVPPLVPGDLNPRIDVATEANQLGGWVTITGDGFAPLGHVSIFADNLAGFPPQELAFVSPDLNEHFSKIIDARFHCAPLPQRDSVTIRAVDDTAGGFATGLTTAYNCPF